MKNSLEEQEMGQTGNSSSLSPIVLNCHCENVECQTILQSYQVENRINCTDIKKKKKKNGIFCLIRTSTCFFIRVKIDVSMALC